MTKIISSSYYWLFLLYFIDSTQFLDDLVLRHSAIGLVLNLPLDCISIHVTHPEELLSTYLSQTFEWFGESSDVVIYNFIFQFARWTFLSVGILYGVSRQASLEKKEEKLKVIRAQNKAIKDAKLAEEKKRASAGVFNSLLSKLKS